MLSAVPAPRQTATEIQIETPDLVQAATMARIASLRHAARLLGIAAVPDANEIGERALAHRHAVRAAREAGAGIEAALAAYADQVEAGREVRSGALDVLAHELEQSLASLDVLLSL